MVKVKPKTRAVKSWIVEFFLGLENRKVEKYPRRKEEENMLGKRLIETLITRINDNYNPSF